MNPDVFAVDGQSLAGHGRGAKKGLHVDEASVFDGGNDE